MGKVLRAIRRLLRIVDIDDLFDIAEAFNFIKKADLDIGEKEDLPGFKTKIGKGYYEIGPIPVKRYR